MRLSTLSAAVLPLVALAAPADNVTAVEPGILVVYSKITHPDLTDAVFNQWYSGEHIHDFVKSGMTDLVLRYKNADRAAKWPYLALYRLPDVTKFFDPEILGSIPTNSDLLPAKEKGKKGGAYTDVMELDMTTFKLEQKFDGPSVKSGKVKGRGKGLTTALIEPKAGTDADFDAWYRKEHLDLLRYVVIVMFPVFFHAREKRPVTCADNLADSKLTGYRRTTRYAKEDAPRFLALHEYDSVGNPSGIGGVVGTKWSQKVLGQAKSKVFDNWSLITEFGKAPEGDAF
jgi:hypothetical protein